MKQKDSSQGSSYFLWGLPPMGGFFCFRGRGGFASSDARGRFRIFGCARFFANETGGFRAGGAGSFLASSKEDVSCCGTSDFFPGEKVTKTPPRTKVLEISFCFREKSAFCSPCAAFHFVRRHALRTLVPCFRRGIRSAGQARWARAASRLLHDEALSEAGSALRMLKSVQSCKRRS